jgi:hypothetical protein
LTVSWDLHLVPVPFELCGRNFGPLVTLAMNLAFIHNQSPQKTHLEETLDIISRGEVQGRLTLLVVEGGVRPVGQEQRAQLGTPLLGRLVQRGEPPLVYKREEGALEQNAQYGTVCAYCTARITSLLIRPWLPYTVPYAPRTVFVVQ